MQRSGPPRRTLTGLTLVEIMVTVALIGVIVALAGPSFKRMIDSQRLRAVNAALITDLQFARAEAASRNRPVVVMFDKTGSAYSCYAILIGDHTLCDCNNAPGNNVCPASAAPGTVELRSVRLERNLQIGLDIPDAQSNAISFDPATGRLQTFAVDEFVDAVQPYRVIIANPSVGGFRDSVEVTGRPTVCSPGSSMQGVTSCPP